MPVVAVIQARLSSQRLPSKVLLPLAGQSVLQRVIERVRAACSVEDVVVATSSEASDDALARACERLRTRCVRGPLDDVLQRFCLAIAATRATTIVRVPADKPFVEPSIIDMLVAAHLRTDVEYTSNIGPRWPNDPSVPIGLEVEVATAAALVRANGEDCTVAEREHVMPYLYRPGSRTQFIATENPFAPLRPRLTLDTREDYEVISAIYDALAKPGAILELSDVKPFLEQHPEILARNAEVEQRVT